MTSLDAARRTLRVNQGKTVVLGNLTRAAAFPAQSRPTARFGAGETIRKVNWAMKEQAQPKRNG